MDLPSPATASAAGAPRRRFDGACDIAALVYGPADRPDRMLGKFAQVLLGRGIDVVGLLQASRPATGRPALACFPDGPRLMADPCGAHTHGSVHWRDVIGRGHDWLLEQMARGPDLVLVNRFGAAECSGGGLVDIIAEAAEREIPLLLPVPEAHFGAWLRFSEGMFVKLACRPRALEHWWSGLARPGRVGDTVCARCK